MKKFLRIVLSLFVILSNLSMHANDNDRLILESMNFNNPKKDVIKNIGRDDFRFVGLYGEGKYFPGISVDDYLLIEKYGLSMIEGTSDLIESKKQKELTDKAIKYAKAYNTLLFSQIIKHNVKPKKGYVPDKATAIAIAVAVWSPIYGKLKIKKEEPYKAILKDGVWFISGSLPSISVGGVAEAEILKESGKIIRISHGQ